MKQEVFDTFVELGFNLKEIEIGHVFDYEKIHMLLIKSEKDDDFLGIAVPGIVGVDEVPNGKVGEFKEVINSSLKYVKAYELGENIWLFYERELTDNEDLTTVIPRMVMQLEASLKFARHALMALDDEQEDYDDDDDDDDDDENNND